MNYLNKIKQSELAFKIKGIANDVFKKWLKNAQKTYDLTPEFIKKIENDQVDKFFLNHLEDAIHSLVEKTSGEKKEIPGWSFGYLCGHLAGSIDVEWVNKYIIEPSVEFEDLLKIKAIISGFKSDNTLVKTTNIIYNLLLKNRVQPTDLIKSQKSKIIPISGYDDSALIKDNEFKKDIIRILSKDLELKILALLDKKKDNCCPDITSYLDIQVIKQIVGKEHFT